MPTVTYKGKAHTVTTGETVLAALLRQGSEIAFSYGKGACAACCSSREDADPPRSMRA